MSRRARAVCNGTTAAQRAPVNKSSVLAQIQANARTYARAHAQECSQCGQCGLATGKSLSLCSPRVLSMYNVHVSSVKHIKYTPLRPVYNIYSIGSILVDSEPGIRDYLAFAHKQHNPHNRFRSSREARSNCTNTYAPCNPSEYVFAHVSVVVHMHS